jgi:hypothetical protein
VSDGNTHIGERFCHEVDIDGVSKGKAHTHVCHHGHIERADHLKHVHAVLHEGLAACPNGVNLMLRNPNSYMQARPPWRSPPTQSGIHRRHAQDYPMVSRTQLCNRVMCSTGVLQIGPVDKRLHDGAAYVTKGIPACSPCRTHSHMLSGCVQR